MTSHREAPSISKDPVADNTDLYAFISPDNPSTVTMLANFIPLEETAGGPNFHSFGDDVIYDIKIDNDGDGVEEVIYRFNFQSEIANGETFLYNTGPISSLTDPNWNIRQFYTVRKLVMKGSHTGTRILGYHLPSPPVNIGPDSTPNYEALASSAIN